jgi:tRNA threonylcarbamoyladenosine biosynthesis protein TsaE
MSTAVYLADDEAGTEDLGRRLAGLLPAGAVVALNGPLGAGKTRLVQAIAAALGVDRAEVASPTFVLVHEYRGQRVIHHLDAYRIRDDDEFLELGPDEFFDGSGLTLVEWAERVQRCLPPERLEIHITPAGETARRFEFTAAGARYEHILQELNAGRKPS